ncbi:hypothetical protein [Streptosporangium sp. NPDC023615]|uniref:hypothetical protein n=1 Tax=Streptosporangium sp. NPDC023615 TaxID=3154794 RepID=UPI003438BAF3
MRDDPIFESIHRMIELRDPEGLLKAGAPDDEYEPEVKDLAALVRGENVITAESVAAVFDHWFGETSTWTTRCPGEVSQVAAELEAMRSRLRR